MWGHVPLLDSLDSGCLQRPPGKGKLGCISKPVSRRGHLRDNLSKPPGLWLCTSWCWKPTQPFPRLLIPAYLRRYFCLSVLLLACCLLLNYSVDKSSCHTENKIWTGSKDCGVGAAVWWGGAGTRFQRFLKLLSIYSRKGHLKCYYFWWQLMILPSTAWILIITSCIKSRRLADPTFVS